MAGEELPQFENKRPANSSVIGFWHVKRKRQAGQLAGTYSIGDMDSTFTPPLAPKPSQPKLRPRQERWRAPGAKAIEDPEQVPDGWNPDEPDLDPDDIVGQIRRCHERIKDNIMPKFFQTRLENYEKRRKDDEKLREGLPAGLDWNVVLRINSLINIKEALEDNGDPDKEIPNIRAMLDEYIAGSLSWIPGKVTYWGRGERLTPAKDFTWEECERLAQNYSATQGFWVEGVRQRSL